MPIFYNRVRRKSNPSDKDSAWKWYPVAKAIKRATQKEIAKYIARETTLNPKEAEMAIAMMAEATEFYLKHGYTVSMGDWASFNLTLSSDGTDKEEDCGPSKVNKVVPHCRFAKSFITRLQIDNEYLIGTSMESERTSPGESEPESGGDVTE